MGWDSTRKLRFYPKNGNLRSINIQAIVDHISNTARSLCNKIVFAENLLANCYDLKFNSSKLSGELVFDPATTEVWDLLSYEESGTLLGNISAMKDFDNTFYEPALFSFDEIQINGDYEQLHSFFQEYIPAFQYLKSKNTIKCEAHQVSIALTGFYNSNNQHDTGNAHRRKKTKKTSCLITPTEFQTLYPVSGLFENLISAKENWIKLEALQNLFEEFEHDNPFDALQSISFLYQKRTVRKVDWMIEENSYTNKKVKYWKYLSADGWANCINPTWKAYKGI